ncbi:hypothetical protein [Fusobacterium sp.]|uniref:hypothetical protein n=1 Tax=Fusobacterium sp. TaxID=68766 RepID=UPI002637BE1C|nr:hypothetical protein [Fusobacterium sp.]
MKKILTVLALGILLSSCGYKEVDKKEKFKLLYEAEVLQKKDAREKMNKINKKLSKYTEKENEKALKDKQEFDNISYYLKDMTLKYKGLLPGWGYLSNDEVAYPPIKEIVAKEGEVVSAQFRLYSEDDGDIYDYLTNKPYSGVAVFRYGTGDIDEVVIFENGKVKSIIQKNKLNRDYKLVQEDFFDKDNRNLICSKKYTSHGDIKEELYILERYSNNNVKKDYIISNGKGKIREYNSKRKIIKEEVI